MARRGAGAAGVLSALVRARRPRERRLNEIAEYHRARVDARAEPELDERSWTDLDMDEVFAVVDRTSSRIGQQMLYHILRSPRFDRDSLAAFEARVTALQEDAVLADRVRRALGPLDERRAAFLANLLFGELPDRPPMSWLFPVLMAASVACVPLSFRWPVAALVLMGLAVVNIAIQLCYKPRVQLIVPALHAIPALVRAAREIGSMEAPPIREDATMLRFAAVALAPLRRATSWLIFEPGETIELVALLYGYLNLLFLLDMNAFVFAIDRVRDHRAALRLAWDTLGVLDVAHAVAEVRSDWAVWARPTFTARQQAIVVRDVRHPILDEAVPNSVAIDGVSVLITGSNMSGKSTFIRTLGVNAVLAQTLNTVRGAEWTAPFLDVWTSIGRNDSLREGKSYYLAEVERVGELLQASGGDRQGLSRFAPYHFRESIETGVLAFDYLIRTGPSSTRNAIALLRVMGYPDSVVDDALATIGLLPSNPAPLA
jgi:DNA mismatch repair ATPase MutS